MRFLVCHQGCELGHPSLGSSSSAGVGSGVAPLSPVPLLALLIP